MKATQYWLRVLSFVLVFACFPVVFAPSANAASVYDGAYQRTDEAYQYWPFGNYQCPTPTNLSSNWAGYILDESKWQFGQTTFMPQLKNSLETALDSGRWGVSFRKSGNGATDGRYIGDVVVFWTEDTSLSLDWIDGGSTKYVYTNPEVYSATITCAKIYQGGNDQPVAFPTLGWNGVALQQGAVEVSNSVNFDANPWNATTYNLFAYTNYPNYPVGYEGELIPSEYTPPTPILSHHTGTVDCMDTEPPAQMLIYQTGNNGSATLTVSSLAGKADWAYDFTDDSYRIAVLCGAKWTYSYGTVAEKNANWYCDPNGVYLKECQLG